MISRAYSLLEIKGVDEDQRILTGIASTPTPDRGDDVLESAGATFTLPMPFLWQHKHGEPLGEVIAASVTPEGIQITAKIATVAEPGRLKDRLDEAWQSIKSGLVRGLSIGWRPVTSKIRPGTMGLHVSKWLWHETSAVTVPMNAEATILSVKAADAASLAALGESSTPPGAAGLPVVRLAPGARGPTMKPYAEQIAGYQSTRDQKFQELSALMTKSAESGETLDAGQSETYDRLKAEIAAADQHIERLKEMETFNKAAAVPVAGGSPELGTVSRAGLLPQVTVTERLDPGIGFARLVMAKTVARIDNRYVLDVCKEMWPTDLRLQNHFTKANIVAGSTTNPVWAAALVDPTNLASEFAAFLRPSTILGKFGMGNIPSLVRVPFNIRWVGQTTGGTGYWVGQGMPKPLTAFEFSATTLGFTKVAAISVITQELARFSSPSAETLVRDGLRDVLVERLDIDLIDPSVAAVAGVNPASLTNGVTAGSSSGTTADAVRADIQNLIETYIASNQNVAGLVLIMPNTLALVLSFMVNDLGQREFPDMTINGGTLLGIPVIASQYAANASGSGNLVVAVNTKEVALADDGQVTVDMSTEASLQMLDNPTNDTVTPTATSMVSMWQTNSIALRAERFVNWQKRRSQAVAYLDDVNWGSIGSPA